MPFENYQHIVKFGVIKVKNIENGLCYIFPKIDGTNGTVWFEDNQIRSGSRNRELSLENDNAKFHAWVIEQDRFKMFFKDYPNLRLFGEWLVPHSIRYYHSEAWHRFYIFDVIDEQNRYLNYDDYSEILKKYDLDFIPTLAIVENPTRDLLIDLMQKNIYLIDRSSDPNLIGEGIVIKNYQFVNHSGRVNWAKLVSSDFRELHIGKKPETKASKSFENQFINSFLTDDLVNKNYHRVMLNEKEMTPDLKLKIMNSVYQDLMVDELAEFVFSNPKAKLDFQELKNKIFGQVRTLIE